MARSPVDRLRLDGIRSATTSEVIDAAEKELWNDWKRGTCFGAQSKQGFLASTIAKRFATLVWGDDDENPEVTWEHPAQIVAGLRSLELPQAPGGTKGLGRRRPRLRDVYLPNEVWKWERASLTRSTMAAPNRVCMSLATSTTVVTGIPRDVGNELWPLPNPLDEVPVVEWVNRPCSASEPLSDIQGTMAMQDAINMLWAYLFTAADHASMPARVVLGAEPPKIPILDEAGQIIGSQPAKLEDLANGRLLFLPGVKDGNARIDQWDAAKLDVFDNVTDSAIGHVAAQSSTPGHSWLTNKFFANLNGDALTAAEVPLVQKCDAAIEGGYDYAARETFRLMAKVRGNDALAEEIRLSAIQWKDRAMHSLAQVADAATKDRAVGMSLATVLRTRYGFTPTEVQAELDRVRAEAMDPVTTELLAKVRSGAGNGA